MNSLYIDNKKYEIKDIAQDTPMLWVLRDHLECVVHVLL